MNYTQSLRPMSHEFLEQKKDAQASENQQARQQKVDIAAQMKWLDFLSHPERHTNQSILPDNSPQKQTKSESSKYSRLTRDTELEQKTNKVSNFNHNPTQGPIIQAYFTEQKTDGDYRVADDLSVAVKDDYPNHLLYAKPGKAEESNKKLEAVDSGITLEEQSNQQEFGQKEDRKSLNQVIPFNKGNQTSGDKMKIWADCGKSAAVIVGGENRVGVYNQPGENQTLTTQANAPIEMKAEIIKKWLAYKLHEPNTEPDEKTKIKESLAKAKRIQEGMDKLEKEYVTTTSDVRKNIILSHYRKQIKAYTLSLMKHYYGKPIKERNKIDEELKINKFANPEVGHGYTMSSGGKKYKKEKTWNFHWAGVVMKSDDSKDNITLENYAVGNASVKNTDWDFAMYGTFKKDQTFHEQHKETKQHGRKPTTMHIKKESK